MGNDGAKDGVIELEGHKFNIVKKGLDQAQVVPFIKELVSQREEVIAQRNTLIQREERISSLAKLAEGAVVEADKLAGEIKKEATEQAKAEAAAIIAKAEEQAQQIMAQERAKAIAIATEQAAAIRADAERETESLMEHQRRSIQHGLRDTAQQLYSQLLSQLGSLKQQVAVLEEEYKHKLSQLGDEISPVTIEEPLSLTRVPAAVQQGTGITPSTKSEASPESADYIYAESQELSSIIEPTNTIEPQEKAPVSADNQGTTTDGKEVEVEILPPLSWAGIIVIMAYLDSLPQVESTELIPRQDKLSIIVVQREPISLIDILRKLPEVGQVKEGTDGEVSVTGTGGTEGKRRKIEITLA